MGGCGQGYDPVALPLERGPVPILQEGWWVSGSVWASAEYLTPTGIRSLEHYTCTLSLYPLRYRHPPFETEAIDLTFRETLETNTHTWYFFAVTTLDYKIETSGE